MKNDIPQIEQLLQDKNQLAIALVAPSFITDFKYPSIIYRLKNSASTK